MTHKTPLAYQRKTVRVYPVEEVARLIAHAYEKETAALRDGLELRLPLELPSGGLTPLSPRLRTLHLLGACCCNCGAAARWVVEKRTKGSTRSRLLFVRDPYVLKPVDIQADHVIPASLGGPSDLGNLVPLCGPCNVRKGCTPTHAIERRWRVRTLFEALVGICPDSMPSVYERYCQFRTLSFCADASSRGAATYSRKDATLFLRMLGDAGDLELDQVESVNWPVSPLEDLAATHGEWLNALAENTQAALQRLPQLRRLPGLQGWEHASGHCGRQAA